MTTRHWLNGLLALAIAAGGMVGMQTRTPSAWANDNGGLFANADTPREEGVGEITPGAFGKISLQVRDLEIGKVLQLLSIQSKRNIVASRNVAGTVTVTLLDVDFNQALDAILTPNNLTFEERDDIIFVYTQDEANRIKEQNRRTTHRVVRLQYLSAADAVALLNSLKSSAGTITPLADPGGSIEPSLASLGAQSYANTNLLVLNDYAENIEKMMALIKELDTRPTQILIEAVIMSVKMDDSNQLGVDFTILADLRSIGAAANPLNRLTGILDGNTQDLGFQSNTAQRSDDGNFKIGFTESNINVVVETLAKVQDTTILSKPKILVLNRQRAKIEVLEKRGFTTTVRTELAESTKVETLDVGTELTVRPFASDDGTIRLEVFPKISTGQIRVAGDQLVPDSAEQSILTNVMMRSGQTVILGGLFEESTELERHQVPFLGDIPILGNAFRNQSDKVTRREYIFMIRASIVKDERLGDGSAAYLDRFEQIQIGAREGLLPWAREKLTASHLQRALAFQRDGDERRALIATRWALSIDPRFVPARQLQEQITGSRPFFPGYEGLQEAVDMFIDVEARKIAPAPEAAEPVSKKTPAKAKPATAEVPPALAPATTVTVEPIVEASPATPATETVDPTPVADQPADPTPVANQGAEVDQQEIAGVEEPTESSEAPASADAQNEPADDWFDAVQAAAGRASENNEQADAGDSKPESDDAQADSSASETTDEAQADAGESKPESDSAQADAGESEADSDGTASAEPTEDDEAQADGEKPSDRDGLAGDWGVLWDDVE